MSVEMSVEVSAEKSCGMCVTLAGGAGEVRVLARGAAAAVLHQLVGANEDAVPRPTLEVPGAAHRTVVFACYQICFVHLN